MEDITPPTTRTGTPFTHRSASAGHSAASESSYYAELREYLGIPSYLSDRSERSLRFSYKKYMAFLSAVQVLEEKWKAKELPFARKPIQEHIIETMQSKTYWYDYIRKYFPKVVEYPEMVAWLENGDDAPSDLEVWGVEKAQYTFGDLDKYLKSGGVGLVTKELEKEKTVKEKKKVTKGKEKVDKSRDRKGKGKERK